MTILCKADDCTLLIIDPQARLMPAIHDGETVVRRCVQLATAARELGIHVIGTEENPDGLGPLVAEIAALCDTTLAKFHFSAPPRKASCAVCPPAATRSSSPAARRTSASCRPWPGCSRRVTP